MCPDILCLNFFCGKLFLRKGLATWVTDARKPQGKGAHARWERWHCPLDGNHSSPERRGRWCPHLWPNPNLYFISIRFSLPSGWEPQESRDTIFSLSEHRSFKHSAWHTVSAQQIREWRNGARGRYHIWGTKSLSSRCLFDFRSTKNIPHFWSSRTLDALTTLLSPGNSRSRLRILKELWPKVPRFPFDLESCHRTDELGHPHKWPI